MIGWLNRKMFEETGDEQKSQGWTPFIVDTNGNGKRDDYVEAGPAGRSDQGQADHRQPYAVAVSPSDGAVWGTVLGYPGGIVRVVPGERSDPYRADRILRAAGARIRTARRRRRRQRRLLGRACERPCRQLRPPQMQGAERADRDSATHCPEGWTLHQLPGRSCRT